MAPTGSEQRFFFAHLMNTSEDRSIALRSRSLPGALVIAGVILTTLLFGWFSVQWQIGNMLAELTSPGDPGAKGIGQIIKEISPDDPTGSWLRAETENEEFSKESLSAAIDGHKETVRLSPNHYPWWLELGRAYEQADRPAEAEEALRQAVKLAPSYTLPRWQLGNFYLRAGRENDALKQLKKAAENDSVYREQVYSIMWDYFQEDTSKLDAIAGNSVDMRVGLAKFYAARELPKKSLSIWKSLPADARTRNKSVGALIARAMFEKRFLRASVEFSNSLGLEKDLKIGAVQNGGFELEISKKDDSFFGWKIDPNENLRVLLSRAKKHSGARSLQISFNDYLKAQLSNIYKAVALEPGQSYRLSFWLKTENLRSPGTPKVEVIGSREGKILGSTDPFPTGTADWKMMTADFTVPDDSDGVVIRTARAYCGEKCSISGTVWYDDFKIEKIKAPDTNDG